jgi:hypothetical protein
MKQFELFPDFQLPHPSKNPQFVMSAGALQQWKQLVLDYQQSAPSNQPEQQTLFKLAPDPCDSDALDPFALQLHNLSFCDRPDWGDRVCLYFVIDNVLPLLLYVGETGRTAKQR